MERRQRLLGYGAGGSGSSVEAADVSPPLSSLRDDFMGAAWQMDEAVLREANTSPLLMQLERESSSERQKERRGEGESWVGGGGGGGRGPLQHRVTLAGVVGCAH